MPIEMPPAIYDHAFAGRIEIYAEYGGELSAWNGPCHQWLGSYACTARIDDVCYIFAIRGKLTPNLLRHEIGHCNGWPGDHPR